MYLYGYSSNICRKYFVGNDSNFSRPAIWNIGTGSSSFLNITEQMKSYPQQIAQSTLTPHVRQKWNQSCWSMAFASWSSRAKSGMTSHSCGAATIARYVVYQKEHIMMTSSNGNILRVTDPHAELWCFLWSALEQTAEKQSRRRWYYYDITVMFYGIS